jgi:hypothetical protein
MAGGGAEVAGGVGDGGVTRATFVWTMIGLRGEAWVVGEGEGGTTRVSS